MNQPVKLHRQGTPQLATANHHTIQWINDSTHSYTSTTTSTTFSSI